MSLKDLKRDFFDGMIRDLMNNKCYELSEIVMAEKIKEKFDKTVNDEIIGLNIYAAQNKFNEYKGQFEILSGQDSQYPFDSMISQELGKTLISFTEDLQKSDKLMLAHQLIRNMKTNQVVYTESLFHNVCMIFVDAQQWEEVSKFLRSLGTSSCQPNMKTIRHLRQNLVYCFSNTVRLDVLDAIE